MLLHSGLRMLPALRRSKAEHQVLGRNHHEEQKTRPRRVQIPLESHRQLWHRRGNLRAGDGVLGARNVRHPRRRDRRDGRVFPRIHRQSLQEKLDFPLRNRPPRREHLDALDDPVAVGSNHTSLQDEGRHQGV